MIIYDDVFCPRSLMQGMESLVPVYRIVNYYARGHVSSIGGLPFSTYAPRGGGGVQVSYTFPLRITCKKGGRGSK